MDESEATWWPTACVGAWMAAESGTKAAAALPASQQEGSLTVGRGPAASGRRLLLRHGGRRVLPHLLEREPIDRGAVRPGPR
jgi:hypothetical protein